MLVEPTSPSVPRDRKVSWRVLLAVLLTAIPLAGPSIGRCHAGEPTPGPSRTQSVQFNRDVRPILSDRCFQCHGPDASQRKGELRLDNPQAATSPAASGIAAIVPGKPEESELLRRVISHDTEEVMPPAKLKKGLNPDQVRLLRTWIEQGAPYEGHWAFIPPERPPVPPVRNSPWVRNPIDAFILARLEKEGLSPSLEADRTTLARRLSLDLLGLPPSVQDVEAFAADRDRDAYSRLVEKDLASPHFGERWARLWLDAARFADSDGYEKDKPRTVHFYRDWVIEAFNRDLPYDRFIVDQIAGDLLPNHTQDELVATGFLRNSMINEEGGIDPEQFRMEAMFDRMDALGKGILGLTVACAQCHSHKYDPLTQEDYYRLFAFLNSTNESNVAVYNPAEQMKRAEVLRRIGEIEARLRHENPDWPDRMRAWEAGVKPEPIPWKIVRTEVDQNNGSGQKHYLLEDGSILAQGYAPTIHVARFTALEPVQTVTAVQLELLNDPALPLNGPGRSTSGGLALTEFQLEAAPADHPDKPAEVKVASATADVNPPETVLAPIFDDKSKRRRVTGPIGFAIDGKEETAWCIDAGPGRRNVPRKAVFVLDKPISYPKGAILTFKLVQKHGGWNSDDNQNQNLGRFRLSVTDRTGATADPLPRPVREILAIPEAQRSPAQVETVFRHWRTTVPQWKAANDQIEAAWREHPEGSSQLVMENRVKPRETHVLQRGDFLKPAKEVGAGVPAFLNPMPAGQPADRLGLARWLVDRRAPTTARAIVNRIWQAYFGTGIVATSEDLGSQCEAPSHPELLDWLAVELMDSGWSLRHIHRLILGSSTYRQSSRVTPELLAKDPYNRLLARGARFRVEAEVVRDVTLAASGLLDPRIGGESVFPTAPAFLFEPPASYGPKSWPEAIGPDRFRRALYTFRYRSVPYPMLQNFDAPNGDFSCVRRTRSNTPLQALTLLNEPISLDAARALAAKTLVEGGTCDADRLAFAFRCCLSRPPAAEESQALLALLKRQGDRFARGEVKAVDLAGVSDASIAKPPTGSTPEELASWTVVARVLLNLDETITRE